MTLTLKQLEAFVWVCDLGSFRKAAERLHTTQPNISARISALEDVLEVRLMERDAGSVRITAKGQQLLGYARDVLKSEERLIEAAGKSQAASGVLRLGVTELVVNTWLRDFLRLAKQAYPNVDIELTVDLSVHISKGLQEHSFDLALQSSPFQRDMKITTALGTYPYVWVVAAALYHPRIDPSQMPILTHARGTIAVDEIERHFSRRKSVKTRVVPTSNMAACLHMAIDGLGIAALPEAMVRQDVASGRLALVKFDWAPKPLKLYARFHTEKAAHYVVRIADLAKQSAKAFDQII